MLTHNTTVALLWLVVFASGGMIGGLIAWWRLSYRLDECCDCCTCKECEPEPRFDYDYTVTRRDTGELILDRPRRHAVEPGPGRYTVEVDGIGTYGPATNREDFSGRRTVLLEPGPTIYPELRALAGEVLDGPEKPAKASESTWYRTTWLDLERRYPIRQDSPRGTMTEALR